MDELVCGRYRIGAHLGCGASAEVFLAEDTQLGRAVAFKRFHPHLLDGPALAARVHAEVALARSLDHPSIACVHELVTDGPIVGVIMEYLPAGDLRRRILRLGPLPAADVVRMADSLLGALAYAHGRGIIHRDLKPRNVLFAADGSVRLADFGLARSVSSAAFSERDTVAGTAEYTAPETVSASLWDARSDLYALGCTLFEALCGCPPFVANTPAEVLRMHVEAVAPALPADVEKTHVALAILVAALLAKDPNERPQSAAEALRILEGAPAARGSRVSVPCPHCGSPTSGRYHWCFTCLRATLPLVGASRKGSTVYVTGPGGRGEKLPAHLRDACSAVAASLGLDAAPMRKKVPRLPFVVCRGLEPSSAGRLRDELERAGLRTLVTGEGAEPGRAGRAMILRKAITMAPRIYAVILGTSFWWFQNITRMPPGAAVATVALVALGVPVSAALAYRRATAKVRTAAAGSHSPAFARLLLTVGDPLVHARVRNVVEAGGALVEAAGRDPSLPGDLARAVRLCADDAAERAASLGLALSGIREGSRYARHTALLSAGEGSAESAAVVRDLEGLYTRTLELVGSTALALHETSVRLARSHQSLTLADVGALRDRITALGDTYEAWGELDGAAGGGDERGA